MRTYYKYNDIVESNELFELLDRMMAFDGDRFPARNVFHRNLRNENKEKESLRNTISVSARTENNELIGYLRIITDNVYIYYILDVMVDPFYRNKGIGSELIKIALQEIKKDGFIKIFLTAIPGAEEFYKKYGFKEGISPVLTMRGEDYIA